ncbi:GntR family transcriptional regulator [Amycolatopsis rubida]|uniref:Regulatory protein, gntR family n=1 Tax=Amycolatopsis rubida TaxID=112413 RepID=A0A1I5X2M2_9PSEU|nr:GntR family transcriptional regulator [Amycolatopsis rubida]SFQ26243.1 regulatory protein, gntR family [Amycolatopsis rubida]
MTETSAEQPVDAGAAEPLAIPQLPTPTTAATIAADLLVAIHQGSLQWGAKVPSQKELMRAYGVAMATAASALSKLDAVGLTHARPRAGRFVVDQPPLSRRHDVLDVLDAASICRYLAATSGGSAPHYVYVGGDPDWDDPHVDPEKKMPPRRVDVTFLYGLDRHVLRWQSEAFVDAARRIVGHGLTDADRHLVAAARAILRDGAARPEGQAPIAQSGGPQPVGEHVALRIWPDRARPLGPDDPPF